MTGTNCGLFTHKSVPVIFEPPCIWMADAARIRGGWTADRLYPRAFRLLVVRQFPPPDTELFSTAQSERLASATRSSFFSFPYLQQFGFANQNGLSTHTHTHTVFEPLRTVPRSSRLKKHPGSGFSKLIRRLHTMKL